MTFPYLKDKFECPGFYIDVPYEKNRESVLYVADQAAEIKTVSGGDDGQTDFGGNSAECGR